MPDEADPPRKNYDFKERAFKRDNVPASDAPPVPTAKELAMMAGPVTRSSQGGAAKADDPNDVYAVLQQNRAAAKKHGLNEVEILQIKSRRKREYWLLLLAIEAGLAVVAVVGRGNPFVLACSVAAMGFIALGLTWIMWQVMNKY